MGLLLTLLFPTKTKVVNGYSGIGWSKTTPFAPPIGNSSCARIALLQVLEHEDTKRNQVTSIEVKIPKTCASVLPSRYMVNYSNALQLALTGDEETLLNIGVFGTSLSGIVHKPGLAQSC